MVNNKKGFLLLEVMVTIVVITCALVFVVRAYSSAKNAMERSVVLFESGLLLESGIFDYEEKGDIEKDFKDGKAFPDDKDYSWSLSSAGVESESFLNNKSKLNVVQLEVARMKDSEQNRLYVSKYSLTTYLDDKIGI